MRHFLTQIITTRFIINTNHLSILSTNISRNWRWLGIEIRTRMSAWTTTQQSPLSLTISSKQIISRRSNRLVVKESPGE